MTSQTWRRSGSAFAITFALVAALLLVGYPGRGNAESESVPTPAATASVPEPSAAAKLPSSKNSASNPTTGVDQQTATGIEDTVTDAETLLQELNQDFQQDEAETSP